MEEQNTNLPGGNQAGGAPTTPNLGENNPAPESKFRKLIFLGILILAVIFFFYADTDKKNGEENNNDEKTQEVSSLEATVTYKEGTLEFKSADGLWTRAEKGSVLKEGYSLEIIGDGKAVVTLSDGSLVRLNSNSNITFTVLKTNEVEILLNEGDIYNRVASNVDRKFTVKFDKYSFEAMGTAYEVFNEKTVKGVKALHNNVKLLGVTDKEMLIQESNKYYIKKDSDKKLENLVLKITETEIKNDGFLMWNKAEDQTIEQFKEELGVLELGKTSTPTTKTETTATTPTKTSGTTDNSFALTGSAVTGGVNLAWKVPSYLNVSQGFKIVRSETINPVYPGNDYQYITDPNTRSFKWPLTNGKTYYFRVCQYKGGYCGTYSNNVKVTAPTLEKEIDNPVTNITVKFTGTNTVSWIAKGYSKNGFKVVWSKSAYPTYPTRTVDRYKYLTDPNATATELNAFDGVGDYYVRVCEYVNGICGVYSNQITVGLK